MTTLWRDLGAPWTILNTLVLFTIFTPFRYPKKKTALWLSCLIGPIAVLNVGLYLLFGSERIGQIFLLTCIVPAAMVTFPFVKYRDGRFFFTFFAVCTISTLITGITHILDFYLPGDRYIVMGVSRLVAFPLVEWAAFRRLREPYLAIQREVERGWWLLSAISALFFVAYVVLFSYPTILTRRPEDLAGVLMVMAAIPLTYVGIFNMLWHQLDAARLREREQLLRSQMTILRQRVEQSAKTEEALSIQRHDLRHRFRTLDALLEQGDTAAARAYVAAADRALAETSPRRWCKNPTLDAMFAVYLGAAQAEGVRVEADLDIPAQLPVDAAELSTAFANALENAVTAVKELPEEERVIRVRAIHQPQVMFRVSNPYRGKVVFDERGRPVSKEPGHGFGIRSIEAYCEKHGAFCEFKAEDGWFEVSIVHV